MAVEISLETGQKRYALTWGRLHSAVDPRPLEALVLEKAGAFSLGAAPRSARVCSTLQEAAAEPYFFEAFYQLIRHGVPFGADYEAWAKTRLRQMKLGKEIYYLGRGRT